MSIYSIFKKSAKCTKNAIFRVRLSRKMSSDSESKSFANLWSSSDEDVMEDDEDDVEESSNTQTVITRCVT